MDFRDYFTLAQRLASGSEEADWRSAISRAYFAAFHVARQLMVSLGFRVPRSERAHAYMWLRLTNSGHPDVIVAGQRLNQMRSERNVADYDDQVSVTQVQADQKVRLVRQIIQALDAAAIEPVRTQITDAMKVYERDVLQDVTWHP